ncbi:uncharacterized protein ccdc142 isoform X3 [Syngnathus typhle]|uniref:uncharacterized protein ccdc142 isoform X3 n=1 Tax=Syngnathus typhle TaxID=161592 RepID=UPI002A6ADCB5|nr:uncharacterized protein ccdc142 isoform X3 [Syngnathus typhle]
MTSACGRGGKQKSGSFTSEEEKKACVSCTTEDLNTNGSWSQRTICHLLRSTFNPRMKWLLPDHSQDDYEGGEENFVVACNLVSRSSARILRLQHVLTSVSMQWQPFSGAQMGSPKICVKGRTMLGDSVLLVPASPFLNKHYQALWKLLEQRSLLLFIHEYTRRAHLTTAYISKVGHLLEDHLRKSHLSSNLMPHLCSSAKVHLVSLCQEFRIHLNHWSCLYAKVQSDLYLRRALAQQNKLLEEIRRTLDLLGLQVLVVMERYVHAVLFAMAQSDSNHTPREVMADVLACTELYNKALDEQRIQYGTTHLRTKLLQQICYTTLTNSLRHQPAAVSVKDLLSIMAAHHANTAANQLHLWTAQQCVCESHAKPGISALLLSRSPSMLTWELLQDTFLNSCSSFHTCHLHTPKLHLENTDSENNQHHSDSEKATFSLIKNTHRKNLSFQCQICTSNNGTVRTDVDRNNPLRNFQHLQESNQPTIYYDLSTSPLSDFCQQDQFKVELLFHVLVSSGDLLGPRLSHPLTPVIQLFPHTVTIEELPPNRKADTNQRIRDCGMEGTYQDIVELDITTRQAVNPSSGSGQPSPKKAVEDGQKDKDGCAYHPRSVQWLDLSQSMLFDDLFGEYRTLLWARCSKALWLQMHVPHGARSTGSINLHDNHRIFQVLQIFRQVSTTGEKITTVQDIHPKECKAMLEEFNVNMLVSAAHAQWDSVVCQGLGAAEKDKCLLTARKQHSRSFALSSNQDDSVMMSETAEYLIKLTQPLLSSLSYCNAPGTLSFFPTWLPFHRLTVSLTLATLQLSTVWVMSKAYQFLSSWSLNKFLLITQGDLKVLKESLDNLVKQTKSLTMSSESNCLSTLHIHNQLGLKQELHKVDVAICDLQAFSSLVLKNFSDDCKRMSAHLFEQTMPSAGHWRLNPRPGFPITPSEYASEAAQNVIGQVLEGVALLSDDVRVHALSLTMTAFMEAWMEHILKQRIKFSVQGALQLKHDFDCIREFISSDRYGLPEELLQQLLSLRVFQQVDSAVLCLLQQPQVRPYLQSSTWEPFIRCCPAKSSGDSLSAAVGSSITNLRGMEGDYMTQSNSSILSTGIPSVDPFIPGEPYLAPSLALGPSQQDWLDLRIHTSSRRWRLPGLQCLSKSEP